MTKSAVGVNGAFSAGGEVGSPGTIKNPPPAVKITEVSSTSSSNATYAADCNAHQRQLFSDSLRAALNLSELRALVVSLGLDPDTVRQTSDRHWTWVARKA